MLSYACLWGAFSVSNGCNQQVTALCPDIWLAMQASLDSVLNNSTACGIENKKARRDELKAFLKLAANIQSQSGGSLPSFSN